VVVFKERRMKSTIWSILLATIVAISGSNAQYIRKSNRHSKVNSTDCYDTGSENIYEYKFETIDGQRNVSLSDYRNHTLLIVNVATYWGYTFTYNQLNALKQRFSNQSFEIIGFPCNQFGQQEPGGTGLEITNGIKYVRPGNGFVPNFLLSKKIEVNGAKEDPIFSYLKRSCPTTQTDFSNRVKLHYDKLHERDVRWNFEKFLIYPGTGKPAKRYDASYEPRHLANDIAQIVQNTRNNRVNNQNTLTTGL